MNQNLTNVSPIDGRYAKSLVSLKEYFSEYAYIKYRVKVEIEYLIKFLQIKKTAKKYKKLQSIEDNFSVDDAQRVKEIEGKIHHDVKAIEYFLREKFKKLGLNKLSSFIHLGLTSEDVNNLAYGLILKEFNRKTVLPEIEIMVKWLNGLIIENKDKVMLARTHGQVAVPTTFGKEIANFNERLLKQQKKLKDFKFEGKLNGAVGNYNALQFVYPKINWQKFSKEFIEDLGLRTNFYTTQILPYDNWLEYFQIIYLINGILLGLAQDMWNYIMLDVLILKKEKNQVGSSTMPQKINPIDFENAEGNIQIANNYFELFQRKLMVSRLQRDLSDSIVKRTFGTAFGHSLLAWKGIVKGLGKISVNEIKTKTELDNHWEVLAEAVQTYLRSVGDEKAYEKLKDLTQGKKIEKKEYLEIISKLGLDKENKFRELTPEKYVGLVRLLTI